MVGVAAWVIAASSARAAPADDFAPFSFALLGDPQIGYGPGGLYGDSQRFNAVADRVAARGWPLTVIPGDLVQHRSRWQHWGFRRGLQRLRGQVLLTAGNHDVADLDDLADFRARYGPDYADHVVHDCAFVTVDSETARDPGISQREYAEQWAWLERTLAAHAAAGRAHIFVVTHRPPFVEREDEPASGRNWPLDTRARLLGLMRAHGARYVLSGHLHDAADAQTRDGIRVLAVAGSARAFDGTAVGYLRVDVGQGGVKTRFVRVMARPPPSPTVRGLRGWTPRILEPSPRHWLFTLLFGLTALAAWRTRRALAARAVPADPAVLGLWRFVSLCLVFFAANWQLDFDELLREGGRAAAKLVGVFPIRHLVTGTALAIGLVAFGVVALRWYRRPTRSWPEATALLALVVPVLWFALSAISHHDLGMLFDEAWWDLLMLAALGTQVLCARRARRVG